MSPHKPKSPPSLYKRMPIRSRFTLAQFHKIFQNSVLKIYNGVEPYNLGDDNLIFNILTFNANYCRFLC